MKLTGNNYTFSLTHKHDKGWHSGEASSVPQQTFQLHQTTIYKYPKQETHLWPQRKEHDVQTNQGWKITMILQIFRNSIRIYTSNIH